MTKSATDPTPDIETIAHPAPLDSRIRRHLGQNLRAFYAETLTAPVSQRLEALIAQIAKPKR